MTHRLLPFLLGLLVLLLLPSCVRWDLGGTIRERAELRVGVNPNERYACPPEFAASVALRAGVYRTVFLAPEVTYRTHSPLINGVPLSSPARVSALTPTGHMRVVVMFYRKPDGWRTWVGERCDLPPGELKPLVAAVGERKKVAPHYEEFDSHRLGFAGVQRDRWYPVLAGAALPLDYVVDPLLSVVSTPVFWGAAWVHRFFVLLTE